MPHINIEIKARCGDPEPIRRHLADRQARYVGTDRQIDTYFAAKQGRLKLREGNIENALIYYERPDQQGPKQSDVTLYHPEPGSSLKEILTNAMTVDVVVEKRREIYFVDNVKFHLDEVEELGRFVEIEAIDADGSIGVAELRRQCDEYVDLFAISPGDLLETSYADLMRAARGDRG